MSKRVNLDAIKSVLDAITPGQWQYDDHSERLEDAKGNWLATVMRDEDAALMVSAAKTIRDLMAEVELLRRIADLADVVSRHAYLEDQEDIDANTALTDTLNDWEFGEKSE